MEIQGYQIRKLKELFPEELQERFKQIFAEAFEKENVTSDCVLEKTQSMASLGETIEIYRKSDERRNHRIASITLNGKVFNLRNDYYVQISKNEGRFKVFKLTE